MAKKEADNRGVSEQEIDDSLFAETFETAAEVKPVEEKPAEQKPAEEPVKPAETTVAAQEKPAEPVVDTTVQQPGESDEKYEQRYKTLQGIHRKDKETWEAKEAEYKAQIEEAKKVTAAPATTPEKKEAVTLADIYDNLTETEKAELKGYDEEFDVISKMEGRKRELAMAKFMKELETFKTDILSKLEPATTFIQDATKKGEELDKEIHFNALQDAHADYEQYRDDGSILKWIESKPKYMQKSLLETYASGTVENVIDLITDFKKENNIPITEPAITQPAETTNVVNIDQKKEAKKQAMTAVTSRRGAVNPAMAVKQDFESVFDEAVARDKK